MIDVRIALIDPGVLQEQPNSILVVAVVPLGAKPKINPRTRSSGGAVKIGQSETNKRQAIVNVLGVPVRKRVIIGVLTILILFLIFVVALVVSKYGKESNKNIQTMFAPYVPFEKSINKSVDPCNDFYDYTCGLWTENEIVQNIDSGKVTTFDILQLYVNKEMKNIIKTARMSKRFPGTVNDAIGYYKLCISENDTSPHESVEYLLNYFNQLMNGWPILNEHWDEKNFDVMKASAFLLKTLHFNTFFDLKSMIDDNDSSKRLLYITPPKFDKTYHPLDSAYTDHMLYVALSTIGQNINYTYVLDSVNAMIITESKWMKHFPTTLRKTNRTTMSIQKLNDEIPNIDWLYYLQIIMNDTLKELNQHLTPQDLIVVEDLDYIKQSISIFQLDTFSKLEVANLFGWFVFQSIWNYIPGVMWKYSMEVDYTEEEFKDIQTTKCFDAVFGLYQCSIDYLYIHNSSHSGISDGKVLVHYIKKVFSELISNSDWMDDATKNSALLKLDSMKSIIGFPSYFNNKVSFSKAYKDFPKLTTNLMETKFNILQFYTRLLVKGIKTENPDYFSFRSITDVSAYYDPQRNIFTLPLSIYHPPFYYYEGPLYLNFGAMGAIIGHEIMHGFDNNGCQRGPKGNLQAWWSNKTSRAFKQRSDCFFEEYASQRDNVSSNSNIDTLDEDIADNEGLHLAYLAYKEWEKDNGPEKSILKDYSSDQLFFLSFGSVWCNKKSPDYHLHHYDKRHSTNYLRTNVVVSNSKSFSEAFNCPSNSPMNPDKRCSIW
ncbi:membrane metallo-endopeptidase-like 1 [Trichonephila clavata]|uniref:Membrane metallo-endopeptidase-like 1 n=1 Tax=Trichonephila clavata TaxID=2740835 RepID=A0A8X6HP73_TRICU|nr:membrane metallo-endopeptidase-like 1 [Trichonephila clavata]